MKKPRVFLIVMEQWIVNGCVLGNPIYNIVGLTGDELQAEHWVSDTFKKTGYRTLALQCPVRFDSSMEEYEP